MEKKPKIRRHRHSLWPAMVALAVVMAAAVGVIGMALFLSAEFTVELQGGETVTLEYGENYQEDGAQVYFAGQALAEPEIEITGEVDPMSLGKYTITYTARILNRTAQTQRTVMIVDTQAPVITLVWDPDAYTEPGNEYIEEGYSAFDGVDGDLTDAVERSEADGIVTYTVTDASGNSTTVERTINYDDRTPPELTLLGDEIVRITAGTAFVEPGYTATDNVDGDITVNVTVSGAYNIEVAGQYTIRYSVSDSHGNTAEATRTLEVEEPEDDGSENTADKVIYLTFDDGPGARTPELLEILDKYDAKVTFFVVGSAHLEYLDEIAAAGHSIGLHANNHSYSQIYASTEAFFVDLFALQDKVYEYTGVTATLYRFPGGSSNLVSKKYCPGIMSELVPMVEKEGFTYFDWHVDSCDAGGATTAQEVYNNVINGISGKSTAVVLQHDVKSYSVDAVEMIIQWGLENGYTFLALDEQSPTAHHHVQN